jgi:hypothetical protein
MSTMEKNEAETIEAHRNMTQKIETLKAQRAEIATDLRVAGVEADERTKDDLEVAATEAREVVQWLASSLAAAERQKSALDKRIDSGDDTVSALKVVEADMAIRTTKGKQKPADAALRKAQRVLDPFLADNHLAFLAVATLEDLVDVPVLVRKRPSDVRGITDVVIVSQTSPTSGYGTLSASGEVSVKVVGNPSVDWEAVKDRLSSTGSDVDVTPQKIVFHSAHWPIPRLSQPSESAVRDYMEDFGRGWHAHVSGAAKAARMRAAGYLLQATTSGWNGLFGVQNIDMNVEGSKALAKVNFIAAAQDGAEFLNPQQIVTNLRELVEIFREGSVGGVTGAGEIVSVSLSDDFKQIHNSVWDAEEFDWNNGRAKRPCTLASSIEIEFRFEPVEV